MVRMRFGFIFLLTPQGVLQLVCFTRFDITSTFKEKLSRCDSKLTKGKVPRGF